MKGQTAFIEMPETWWKSTGGTQTQVKLKTNKHKLGNHLKVLSSVIYDRFL